MDLLKDEPVNRVANSGLITFNLEDFYFRGEREIIDIKDVLFMGLILKEKEFRTWVEAFDWSFYQGKVVSIICSADAIVPTWAYMLIATKLSQIAEYFCFGSAEFLNQALFFHALSNHDFSVYQDRKVVIKGCSQIEVPVSVYVEASRRLMPYAQKIMYGEPCSTVPLYKK